MSYNYEQSIWGQGEASLRPSDPTSFRLFQALAAVAALPVGAKVLEVGCGAGQFIRAVKRCRSDLVCFGCDISVNAITLATQHHDGVGYAVSGETFPYGEAALDAVFIFDVLEHVESPASLLTEVKRVLKPGGILYIFVPCEGDSLSFWHWLRHFGIWGDLTKKYAGHINYFSRASLRGLIKESSLAFQRASYSEQFFGQLLGVVAFVLMDRTAKKNVGQQINNEIYFSGKSKLLVRVIKFLVNSLVYFESRLLFWLPSPNVHLVAIKK